MAKLQVARVLAELRRDFPNFKSMSAAINSAVKKLSAAGKAPDFRKLESIINGETAPNLEHWKAIEAFLRTKGHLGLESIRVFEPESLLRSVVECGRVTFYLPSIVQEIVGAKGARREYISNWDLRAFYSITDDVNEIWPQVRIEVKAVPPLPEDKHPKDVEWNHYVMERDVTYCSIGSPLVNPLSGYLLGKIFNVKEPFLPRPHHGPPIPFCFSWYPRDGDSGRRSYESAFAEGPDDLTNERDVSSELVEEIRNKNAQAFRFRNELFVARVKQEEHEQFGIVAAQKREGGETYLVVCGLSGPSTLACAEMVPQIKRSIPDLENGNVSRIIFEAIRCKVHEVADKAYGDLREPYKAEFIVPTDEFPSSG